MKLRIIITSFLALATIVVAACATASGATLPPTNYSFTEEQFAQQKDIQQNVVIDAGKSFTVTLPSNASTGFAWAGAAVSESPVRVADHKYVARQAMPGAGGQEVWMFKATNAGIATIRLDYSRPWDGGEKAVRTLTINVTVR